jgi:hypothetical protein
LAADPKGENQMRLTLAVLAFLFASLARADTVVPIEIPVQDQQTTLHGQYIFPISGLSDIPLDGQTIDLDFIFVPPPPTVSCPAGFSCIIGFPAQQPLLLRVNANEEASGILGPFGVALQFQTTAPSFPGFPSGVGGFLDAHGNPIKDNSLGGVEISNGAFGLGPDTDRESLGLAPGSSVFITSGIDLALTLPTSGFTTTGADLILNINGDDTAEFATASQLPEPGSLAFLLLGLPVLLWRKYAKDWHAQTS